MSGTAHKNGRGVALIAVLVVVAIGALVGSTLLYGAVAAREVGAASVRLQQSRMSAWSGVQAVMAELAGQRDDLLRGADPRVTRAMRLGAAEGGGIGVFRIVAAGGEELGSEGGKLDVNTAPAGMLAKLPGMDEAAAERIVTARGQRGIGSVLELTFVQGAGGEEGEVADGGPGAERPTFPGHEGTDTGTSGDGPDELTDLLTVFSFDPDVQSGVGPRASAARGERRVAVNGEWGGELEREIGSRMERGSAEVLTKLIQGEKTFGNCRAVVEELIATGVPPAAWGAVIDAVTVSESEFLRGRVDVNRAPAAVLACVPGIDEGAAGRIVEARRSISSEDRATVAWLVTEGVLAPERFAEAVDHLTSRTMQWRVVVEGGRLAQPAEEAGAIEIGGVTGDDVGDVPADAVLADRVVLEAVIDVAGERPRVAYLRDITMLPVARVLAQRAARAVETKGRDAGELAASGPAGDDGGEVEPPSGGREEALAESSTVGSGVRDAAIPREGAREGGTPPVNGGRIGRWTGGAGGGR